MKVLIAIPSCHALRHYEQAIRNTWGKDVPSGVDLKFFLGNPAVALERDEVSLKVGDALQDLTHKVVAMFRWALDQSYDFTLKVDLDTLVRPQAWLESDFKQFSWVGGQNSFFASGGGGYSLSKAAMQAVVDHLIEPGPAEDVNTARALLAQGIELHGDSRYKFCPGDVLLPTDLTYHLSSVKAWDAKASPQDMYAAYNGTFALPVPEVKEQRWLRRKI
jgi:hypothetical protein